MSGHRRCANHPTSRPVWPPWRDCRRRAHRIIERRPRKPSQRCRAQNRDGGQHRNTGKATSERMTIDVHKDISAESLKLAYKAYKQRACQILVSGSQPNLGHFQLNQESCKRHWSHAALIPDHDRRTSGPKPASCRYFLPSLDCLRGETGRRNGSQVQNDPPLQQAVRTEQPKKF